MHAHTTLSRIFVSFSTYIHFFNYHVVYRLIGLAPNGKIARVCNDVEAHPVTQIVIDDEFGPIGPGGMRALMTAVMGSGPGMKGGPYKLLKSIRVWRSYVGDEGAAAIAEVLRLGGAEVQITYLELFGTWKLFFI